jgi:hypothetical protein
MTESTVSETEGLKYTLLLAVIIFLILLTCFESIRGIKNIFLKRITRKFQVFRSMLILISGFPFIRRKTNESQNLPQHISWDGFDISYKSLSQSSSIWLV